MSTIFEGKKLTIPQAKGVVRVDRAVRASIAHANIGAVIAQADRGTGDRGVGPNGFKLFSSLGDVIREYHGGDIVDIARQFFNPSPRVRGGEFLYCAASNPLTQGTHDLLNGGSAAAVTLTTKGYGNFTGNYEIKVEEDPANGFHDGASPAVSSAKKITIRNVSDNMLEVFYGLGSILAIHYTGTAENAVLEIKDNGDGYKLQIATHADAGESYPDDAVMLLGAGAGTAIGAAYANWDGILLTDEIVNTPAKLVAYLNNHVSGDFKAWIWSRAPRSSLSRSTATLFGRPWLLDTSVDGLTHGIKFAESAEPSKQATLCSFLYAAIDSINDRSAHVTADLKSGFSVPTTLAGRNLKTLAYTVLSTPGTGSTSTPTTTNWSDRLTALETVQAQIIICGSEDESVWAMFKDHCIDMGNRHFHCGTAAGATLAEAQTMAIALNSDRAVFTWPNAKLYGRDGSVRLATGPEMAALHAGLCAGQAPDEPAGHDYLNILGVEDTLTKAELVEAQNCGISAVVPVPGTEPGQTIKGFWLSKSVTTVQDNQRGWNLDGTTPELSYRRLADLLVQTGETNAEVDLVQRSSRYAKPIARSWFEGLLKDFRDAGYLQEGIDPNDGQRYPGYRNIVITQQDDVLAMSAEVNFTSPVNFVPMTFWVLPPRDIL